MEVRIAVAEAEREAALIDLYRWLRQDPDVRRHTPVTLAPGTPGDGSMGAVDVIELIVGQGLSALNLVLSYAAWRNTRPSAPSLTITVNGGSLTVRDASEETIRRIVAELAAPAGGPDGSADGEGRGEDAQPHDDAPDAD